MYEGEKTQSRLYSAFSLAWFESKVASLTTANALNPFNASCSKLLLFEGFSAILV